MSATVPSSARTSLRTRIDAMCKRCIYDPKAGKGAGGWRQQVAACTIGDCPLWAIRPQSRQPA